MDTFVSRKRRRISPVEAETRSPAIQNNTTCEDDSTDFKLAVLASLHPGVEQDQLLEALLVAEGSVEAASRSLEPNLESQSPRKLFIAAKVPGYQASLASFRKPSLDGGNSKKQLTRKGKTLHLYSPDDIAAYTPCSIIHNFLSPQDADALLYELLAEAPSFTKDSFRVFENVVQSPHTNAFYVDTLDEAHTQQTEYLYNGAYIRDVRETLPEMRKVGALVRTAVNHEIQKRIQIHYPAGKKLKYQSPAEWIPNASFVNCYDGGAESVGYHSDQLTYLGPRAVIGSLSLGVAREFRVRRVVPRDIETAVKDKRTDDLRADAEGQISIHLPHNSLLVMHADMQEEWKHSIAPAQAIDPHPIAKNKRINITYRHYRESFHPRYTPKCRCGVPTVLRCVQRKKENRGRYMWMCHAGLTPERAEGCTFFQWAEFDHDGEPPWAAKAVKKESALSDDTKIDNQPS